jgi:hypothetical protein
VLIDAAKRDEVVAARLRPSGRRLWGEFSDADQSRFVEGHKAFLKSVGDAFAPVTMQLTETEYFLFYTDMPLAQVGGYIAYLDAMYIELCRAFGVPRGKKIWRGKCVIVAFSQQASFLRLEAEVMIVADAEGRQGLHHGSRDDKVIISCWRGDPVFFAHILVQETSHGFMHRFRFTIHVSPWINEGVADWVAAAVVRNCPETERRQREALAEMKRTGSMGGNFFSDSTRLERWQYGVASHITS